MPLHLLHEALLIWEAPEHLERIMLLISVECSSGISQLSLPANDLELFASSADNLNAVGHNGLIKLVEPLADILVH